LGGATRSSTNESSGRAGPKVVTVPVAYRMASAAMGLVAGVATLVRRTRGDDPATRVQAVFCCSPLGRRPLRWSFRYGPAIWRAEAEYIVTDQHVTWEARSPAGAPWTGAPSAFARHSLAPEHPRQSATSNLVRAGADWGPCRRRLSLLLPGRGRSPSRVWAIVARRNRFRKSAGDGQRPLSQRLDDGERVLWVGTADGWLAVHGSPPEARELCHPPVSGWSWPSRFVHQLRASIPAAPPRARSGDLPLRLSWR